MTVPKSRKTSAVAIYSARQGMRVARQGMRSCNNTKMCNPIIKDVGGVVPLIRFACPHPLSWPIYTALIPCLAACYKALHTGIRSLLVQKPR